jgi:probable rRNA maturation factor
MIDFIYIDTTKQAKFETIATQAVALVMDDLPYNITLALCTDDYILEKNNAVLDHNYYTDILTFYYDDLNPEQDAELLISIDRIKENAKTNQVTFDNEFARVVIHGCLHLLGFDDQTRQEKKEIRLQENKYLNKLFHVEQ